MLDVHTRLAAWKGHNFAEAIVQYWYRERMMAQEILNY
jgi:hypothetical protein